MKQYNQNWCYEGGPNDDGSFYVVTYLDAYGKRSKPLRLVQSGAGEFLEVNGKGGSYFADRADAQKAIRATKRHPIHRIDQRYRTHKILPEVME